MNPVARTAVTSTAEIGSLAGVAISEILGRVNLKELSGAFEVSTDGIVRTIHFDRGFIVFAASTSPNERLGQCLLEAGRITEEGIEIALNAMQGRQRIGQSMVETGLITKEMLGSELVRQARKVATAMYAQEGFFRFEEEPCRIPMDLRISVSIYRLQLEGIRKIPNHALLREALPARTELIRVTKTPAFSFDGVEFETLELDVMAASRPERQLGEIIDHVALGLEEAERAIYGLLCSGILERVSRDGSVQRLRVEEETGNFLVSPLSADNTEASENVAQAVLLAFESSERASPEELLELAPNATEVEIRRAFATKVAEWDTKRAQLDPNDPLVTKVDEIKQSLETAKYKLLDESAPSLPQVPEPQKVAVSDKSDESRLLGDIHAKQMTGDSEGAITFLYELVRVAPNKAKHELMLAKALAEHRVLKKKAERHFRRALSLDSQDAEAHYLLGRYYQSLDMSSRAVTEFEAALAISPQHSETRSALAKLKGGGGSLQERLKGWFS